VPRFLDPTPFVSLEDFDLGLFLARLSADVERRERVLRPDEPMGSSA
jgi:hypothetical protein